MVSRWHQGSFHRASAGGADNPHVTVLDSSKFPQKVLGQVRRHPPDCQSAGFRSADVDRQSGQLSTPLGADGIDLYPLSGAPADLEPSCPACEDQVDGCACTLGHSVDQGSQIVYEGGDLRPQRSGEAFHDGVGS